MLGIRAGRAADLPALLALWREAVADGRRDATPTGSWLGRATEGVDWELCSRVVERGGRVVAALLVLERPGRDGLVTRLEGGSGDRALEIELVRWGLGLSIALGAVAAQCWRARGDGAGLAELGFGEPRPFWRMDRAHLRDIPAAPPPAGYRLVSVADPGPAPDVVDVLNRSFADHWRAAPWPPDGYRRRRAAPGHRPDLDLVGLDPSGQAGGLVLCDIERYADDRRGQPVGIVNNVGTAPGHRRIGLAHALVAEALRRLAGAGATSSSLYVDGLSANRAFEVYRDLGYGVAFEMEVWERSLA